MKTIKELILQELPHLDIQELLEIRADIDRLTGSDEWRQEAKRIKEAEGPLYAVKYVRANRGYELKVCKQIVDQL